MGTTSAMASIIVALAFALGQIPAVAQETLAPTPCVDTSNEFVQEGVEGFTLVDENSINGFYLRFVPDTECREKVPCHYEHLINAQSAADPDTNTDLFHNGEPYKCQHEKDCINGDPTNPDTPSCWTNCESTVGNPCDPTDAPTDEQDTRNPTSSPTPTTVVDTSAPTGAPTPCENPTGGSSITMNIHPNDMQTNCNGVVIPVPGAVGCVDATANAIAVFEQSYLLGCYTQCDGGDVAVTSTTCAPSTAYPSGDVLQITLNWECCGTAAPTSSIIVDTLAPSSAPTPCVDTSNEFVQEGKKGFYLMDTLPSPNNGFFLRDADPLRKCREVVPCNGEQLALDQLGGLTDTNADWFDSSGVPYKCRQKKECGDNGNTNPCPDDVKTCPDGTELTRDPLNNCEFPDCAKGNPRLRGTDEIPPLPQEPICWSTCENVHPCTDAPTTPTDAPTDAPTTPTDAPTPEFNDNGAAHTATGAASLLLPAAILALLK